MNKNIHTNIHISKRSICKNRIDILQPTFQLHNELEDEFSKLFRVA